ncbi:MAG: response regulator [Deltaproteobacteria bacterium]|nr:response regulator [Deltaproteobacteria bacterium]
MKKILVVDNHLVILKFMTHLLEGMGHTVITAEDGLAALDVLESYRPEIIFIDLIMPRIDGKKLCRIIRNMPELKSVFIVILSAVAAEDNLDFISLGANACIAKCPPKIMKDYISALLDSPDFGASQGLQNKILGCEAIKQRQISKELLQSGRHYQEILHHLSEGVIELASNERIIFVNSTAVDLIHMPEEKVLGSGFRDLFQKQYQDKIIELLKGNYINSNNNPNPFTLPLNGSQVEIKVIPVKGGEENAKIVILNDVTEHKKMELQLRYAQKMEAVGTLSGGIAHDFNNILMGIQGNVSLALLNINLEEANYLKLKNIEKYVNNGAKLTRQLLEYSRGGKYEVKTTDLNKIIKKQIDLFSPTRKEITIIGDYDPELWPVEVDQGQIEQVLLNFYINSSQAMQGCGKLFIKTKNIIIPANHKFPFNVNSGRYANVTVTDTGAGISSDNIDKIFDPFFTTKEVGVGSGLGLASVYGIIKNHGGFIDVKSTLGKGASFLFYLPVSNNKVKKEKIVFEDIAKADETVLLVDDEEMIIDVGKSILEYMGYSVLTARSGKEALDIIKNSFILKREGRASAAVSVKPDLVILDMIMPDMDGGAVYDAIREMCPDIKVVLSSGYSENGKINKIMERGCNGFIQKPFNLKQLSQKIRTVIDDSQSLRMAAQN